MKKLLAFCLAILLGLSPQAWAAHSLKDLNLPVMIPVQSSYYTVDSKVEEAREPGFLKFHVRAPHAEYDEEGFLPLRKLLHEIVVIEQIQKEQTGSGFMEGASDSVEATGKGFANLFRHPVGSAKGIGKAAGKLGGKVGGTFRKKEEGEKTTFGEKMLGGAKRELAKRYGVDVYSTNPHLQELLGGMARSRMGGQGAVAVAKFLLPIAALASIAVTASGINSAADQLVNDSDRGDLFRMNQDALMALGFPGEEVLEFLNSLYYSPRELTYLRFYLEALKSARGFGDIFTKARKARFLWEARRILYAAEIVSQLAKERDGVQQVFVAEEGIAAVSKDRLILAAPYDYLDKTKLGERVLERSLELKKKAAKNSAEIWCAGGMNRDFSREASSKGIRVRDWVLFSGSGE